MNKRVYVDPASRGPIGPTKDRPLVTSVGVELLGGHEHVSIFVRGQKAGDIIVDEGDADALARRLIPGKPIMEEYRA